MDPIKSSDRNPSAFHRVRAVAKPVMRLKATGGGEPASIKNSFYVGLPDARARVELAVLFVPDVGMATAAASDPTDAAWDDVFSATLGATLAIKARVRAEEQGGAVLPVDNVLGTFAAPVRLPGETFGWLITKTPEGREWECRLECPVMSWGATVGGTWVAVATYTAAVTMTDEEWQRVIERVYVRADCKTYNSNNE